MNLNDYYSLEPMEAITCYIYNNIVMELPNGTLKISNPSACFMIASIFKNVMLNFKPDEISTRLALKAFPLPTPESITIEFSEYLQQQIKKFLIDESSTQDKFNEIEELIDTNFNQTFFNQIDFKKRLQHLDDIFVY